MRAALFLSERHAGLAAGGHGGNPWCVRAVPPAAGSAGSHRHRNRDGETRARQKVQPPARSALWCSTRRARAGERYHRPGRSARGHRPLALSKNFRRKSVPRRKNPRKWRWSEAIESLHIPDFPQCLPHPFTSSTRNAFPPPACWSFPVASISSNSCSSKNSSPERKITWLIEESSHHDPAAARLSRKIRFGRDVFRRRRRAGLGRNPTPALPRQRRRADLRPRPGRRAQRHFLPHSSVPPPRAVRLRLAAAARRHRLSAGIQPVRSNADQPCRPRCWPSPNRLPPRKRAWRPTNRRCWKRPKRPSARGPCSRDRWP